MGLSFAAFFYFLPDAPFPGLPAFDGMYACLPDGIKLKLL
jgi:hypothetical protein